MLNGSPTRFLACLLAVQNRISFPLNPNQLVCIGHAVLLSCDSLNIYSVLTNSRFEQRAGRTFADKYSHGLRAPRKTKKLFLSIRERSFLLFFKYSRIAKRNKSKFKSRHFVITLFCRYRTKRTSVRCIFVESRRRAPSRSRSNEIKGALPATGKK